VKNENSRQKIQSAHSPSGRVDHRRLPIVLRCGFGAGKPISCVAELNGVSLEGVLQKRRLDQALNAKEFAVVAGVSYSTARQWLRLPGFPALHGVVFWSDLVEWRRSTLGIPTQGNAEENQVSQPKNRMLPLRALQILSEAG
jgi:hypothetical protein